MLVAKLDSFGFAFMAETRLVIELSHINHSYYRQSKPHKCSTVNM